MILLSCVIFSLGLSWLEFSNQFYTIYAARLIMGIGIGIVVVAVPLYLSEIAAPSIRGRSVTLFQLMLTFGIMLAYVVNLFFQSTGNWRGMFSISYIPAAVLFLIMLFLPETPRFLFSKGYLDKAKAILHRILEKEVADEEFNSISRATGNVASGSWKSLFERNLWLPLFIALSIATLNQFTGINVLLQYAPIVIQHSGLASVSGSMFGAVGIGFVNLLATFLSLFLIDRLGRKKLLVIGTSGIIISYIYLALLNFLLPFGALQAKLSLIGLFGYITFFAVGPGVVVWLVISELLPTRVRGKAVALCLFTNSLAATLLSSSFLIMEHRLGIGGVYLLFAAFTVLYFLVSFFLLPETKGKSLEEIQKSFEG
jgi:sugar porter (SP) family MFS transporter